MKTHRGGQAGRGRGRGGGRGERHGKDNHRGRGRSGPGERGYEASRRTFKADDDSKPFTFSKNLPRRVPVDQETKHYFVQLSDLIGEGGSVVDPEERAILTANALGEASGKELQLACDVPCSRVLENLLAAADLEHLLVFLRGCSPSFASISIHFAGSHVADAVLGALTRMVRDGSIPGEGFRAVESALGPVCEVIGGALLDVICNRYGSHVYRNLLALCSGVTLEAASQGSAVAAEKLETRLVRAYNSAVAPPKYVFPTLIGSLVDGILGLATEDIKRLLTDSAAVPVLQAVLKVLDGDSSAITQIVAMLLECGLENVGQEGRVLEAASIPTVLESMKGYYSSHLFETMLQVVPDSLFLEIFERFFKQHLLELARHKSGNFVVQSLISSARHEDQVNTIVDELQGNFLDLIKEQRAGVIAVLVAACGRFRTRQHEVCRILAHAVNGETSDSTGLVSRFLCLESFCSPLEDHRAQPTLGAKGSVIGSTILQIIFGFPQEHSQPFLKSMLAMTAADAVDMVKDSIGSHVVEAFLESSAPAKLKRRFIAKFKGQFADLAVLQASSYAVLKCFDKADIKLKEAIVTELARVQATLSKTKRGPFLLQKLDVAIFSRVPELWKSRQAAKEETRAAFAELVGDKIGEEEATPGHEVSGTLGKTKGGQTTSGTTISATGKNRQNGAGHHESKGGRKPKGPKKESADVLASVVKDSQAADALPDALKKKKKKRKRESSGETGVIAGKRSNRTQMVFS